MLVRGVPASLDKEKTRLRGGFRSGLMSLEAAEGSVLVCAEGGRSDLDNAPVASESTPKGTDSNRGVSSLGSSGGAGDADGDGGNLKLEGGIFKACGIRPDALRVCEDCGVTAAPLPPTEACRACGAACIGAGLSQGKPSGTDVAVASGDGAGFVPTLPNKVVSHVHYFPQTAYELTS